MAKDVLTLIMEKSNQNHNNTHIALKDVNKDLIVTLMALPLYGKAVRDEEILSVIINAGPSRLEQTLEQIKTRFEERLKAKEIKKGKDGYYHQKNGLIVLNPR